MEIQDLKSANHCWSTQQLCSVMVINSANHSIQERFFPITITDASGTLWSKMNGVSDITEQNACSERGTWNCLRDKGRMTSSSWAASNIFYASDIKCRQPHVYSHNYTSYVDSLHPKVFHSFPVCMDICGMLLWLTEGTARLSGIAPVSFCSVGLLEIIRMWSGPNERSDYGSLFFIYFLSWSYIMTKWIYACFLPFTVF